TPYFKSNLLILTSTIDKNYTEIDSFILYICTKGSFTISVNSKTYSVAKGETILIPASMKNLVLATNDNAEILEVYY
ncbi:MAG TPA: mannose-6-phosphate isomerase, partial [Flavobacterium sp.]|nr:mannose-6-phosphate isomerase [Flavobacterium sp.]